MIWILSIPLLIGLTLALFIADQRIQPAEDLHWLAKSLLLPWQYIGLGLDIALNTVVASVVFLERPKEWTLSARIKRHEHEGSGWRQRLAIWICTGFLRPIDKDHC